MTVTAELLAQVCRVIADTTGNNLEEVMEDSLFEDDLGMSELELERVLVKLNKVFSIHLDLKAVLSEGIESVGDLTKMVAEESELG
ncbi:MAG: hypothetical protein A3A82_02965 [Candidatus Pacebacteria bacterium RIFCSPLOWO2_01_FULL_47_12]|nr:MAG: hypothetical protein A3J60_00265 [Candidatus Pacebacteria bacterium RIFCSPHIGHO2_02_FULL_46_9]OGJ37166.1 MAG: hypothetical protein A3A82_02965 [Candidatus Pacebacteria bacterium RIFCSPLOWO2_01_FULL_47_12]